MTSQLSGTWPNHEQLDNGGRSGSLSTERILQSNGIAPNNETTWELQKEKHPRGPVPLV